MPHITVRGIPKDTLQAMSAELKNIVVVKAQVDEQYVKVFYSPVERMDGENEAAVDVYWMPRTQQMCDDVSAGLTAFLQKAGFEFVQVTFTEFEGRLFYENNVHY